MTQLFYILAVLLFIGFIIFSIIIFIFEGKQGNQGLPYYVGANIGCIMGVLISLLTYIYIRGDYPEAIDVYREKTDLNIQYTILEGDTIFCDSTVVWKENKK